MLTSKMWIALCIVASVAAIFLYRTIDSMWARENNLTIVMTIVFFLVASLAIMCGFNAATMSNHHTHRTGHE